MQVDSLRCGVCNHTHTVHHKLPSKIRRTFKLFLSKLGTLNIGIPVSSEACTPNDKILLDPASIK